jgi:AcrR family transcriptional regulator
VSFFDGRIPFLQQKATIHDMGGSTDGHFDPAGGGASDVAASPAAQPSLVDAAVERRLAVQQRSAEHEVHRLLAVALELMVRGGTTGPPRVADIVQAAGVSNDAFYRSFRSKDDLVAAVVDEGARRLVTYVRHRMEREADPAAQVRAGVEAVMKQASDREVAAATRAVFHNASRVADRRTTDRVHLTAWIGGLFETPLRALGVPDPERDARVAALVALAAMRHFIWAEDAPTGADVDHLVGFVLRGVGAESAQGWPAVR